MAYGDFKDLSEGTASDARNTLKRYLMLLNTQNMTDTSLKFHQWLQ